MNLPADIHSYVQVRFPASEREAAIGEPLGCRMGAAIPARQSCPLGTVMAHGEVVAGAAVGRVSGNFRGQLPGDGGVAENWRPGFLKNWRSEVQLTGGEFAKAKGSSRHITVTYSFKYTALKPPFVTNSS